MRDPIARAKRIGEVLADLEEDADHPEWERLLHHVDTLDRLPPNTFDAVVEMTKHPRACAAALLRLDPPKRYLLLDALERLPFMWHLVPVWSWEQALLLDARRRERLQILRAEALREAGLEDVTQGEPVAEAYRTIRDELKSRNMGAATGLEGAEPGNPTPTNPMAPSELRAHASATPAAAGNAPSRSTVGGCSVAAAAM